MAKTPKPPTKIYLQWHGVDRLHLDRKDRWIQPDFADVTWCSDEIYDTDVEYIRADVVRERLRKAKRR